MGKHQPGPRRRPRCKRKPAAWLREQSADVVLSIEDAAEGHGALMRSEKNARRVLGLFSGVPP